MKLTKLFTSVFLLSIAGSSFASYTKNCPNDMLYDYEQRNDAESEKEAIAFMERGPKIVKKFCDCYVTAAKKRGIKDNKTAMQKYWTTKEGAKLQQKCEKASNYPSL